MISRNGCYAKTPDVVLRTFEEWGHAYAFTPSEPDIIDLATTLQQEIRQLQPCLFLGGTGREITWRKGAVLQARPAVERPGEIGIARPVSVGPAGLYVSRAWWFRNPVDVLESRSGSGEGETESGSAEGSPAAGKGGLP